MEKAKNILLVILAVAILLVLADIVLNDGGAIASFNDSATYTVVDPNLNNMVVVTSSAPVQQIVVTAESQSQQVIDLVPTQPGLQPGFAEATGTAFALTRMPTEQPTQPPEKEPTREFTITDEQLAACLQAQQTGRRLAPYCPPNPAEYAGQGR